MDGNRHALPYDHTYNNRNLVYFLDSYAAADIEFVNPHLDADLHTHAYDNAGTLNNRNQDGNGHPFLHLYEPFGDTQPFATRAPYFDVHPYLDSRLPSIRQPNEHSDLDPFIHEDRDPHLSHLDRNEIAPASQSDRYWMQLDLQQQF